MNKKKRQLGVGLIEVVVAILVLSIGMLGLASIQINGIKITQETASRFQANVLANDIIERMRANIILANTATPPSDDSYVYVVGDTSSFTPTAEDCEANVCTTTELVKWDKSQWKAAIEASLPGGVGKITFIDPPTSGVTTRTYTVVIFYVGNTDGVLEEVVVNVVL